MLNLNKSSKNKGFSLIEVVAALGIVVVMGGLTFASLSAIPQAKMKKAAQEIKNEFEITRNLARTHGGDATFTLEKVPKGVIVEHVGKNVEKEETFIKDRNLEVFYKLTGDNNEYQLGQTDPMEIKDKELKMTFKQTSGKIIGPHYIDYITISNGSKNYKLFIKQDTGMMYYSHELKNEALENQKPIVSTIVTPPTFTNNGHPSNTMVVPYNGKATQPVIAYDSRHIKIGGVYNAIDKGQYTITFNLKDPYSARWADGTEGEKTLTWTIE